MGSIQEERHAEQVCTTAVHQAPLNLPLPLAAHTGQTLKIGQIEFREMWEEGSSTFVRTVTKPEFGESGMGCLVVRAWLATDAVFSAPQAPGRVENT